MRLLVLVNLFFATFIFGCSRGIKNSKNVHVKACIIDSVTNKPIPNARVTLLCWYRAKYDKTDYVSIDTTTDSNGCFNGSFVEGYKVVVASVAANYRPNLSETSKLDKGVIEIRIGLLQERNPIIPPNKLNLRDFIVQNSSN